jgi:hypothetical protein
MRVVGAARVIYRYEVGSYNRGIAIERGTLPQGFSSGVKTSLRTLGCQSAAMAVNSGKPALAAAIKLHITEALTTSA